MAWFVLPAATSLSTSISRCTQGDGAYRLRRIGSGNCSRGLSPARLRVQLPTCPQPGRNVRHGAPLLFHHLAAERLGRSTHRPSVNLARHADTRDATAPHICGVAPKVGCENHVGDRHDCAVHLHRNAQGCEAGQAGGVQGLVRHHRPSSLMNPACWRSRHLRTPWPMWSRWSRSTRTRSQWFTTWR